jgi:hypothetical protein
MPYTSRPDAQQRAPRNPTFFLVHGKTVVGPGKNRLKIYPMRGETSERQMIVYFPEYQLLYGGCERPSRRASVLHDASGPGSLI